MLPAILVSLAINLVPLNDLGPAPYAYGYFGGLYDDGSNTPPTDHLAAGLRQAGNVTPRGRRPPFRALPPQGADAYRLKGAIAATLRELKARYPNLQIAYPSSRVYGDMRRPRGIPSPSPTKPPYQTAGSSSDRSL